MTAWFIDTIIALGYIMIASLWKPIKMAVPQLVQHRQFQKIAMFILDQSLPEAALYYRAPDKNLHPLNPEQQHLPVLRGQKTWDNFAMFHKEKFHPSVTHSTASESFRI